jgi:hypothetical protein
MHAGRSCHRRGCRDCRRDLISSAGVRGPGGLEGPGLAAGKCNTLTLSSVPAPHAPAACRCAWTPASLASNAYNRCRPIDPTSQGAAPAYDVNAQVVPAVARVFLGVLEDLARRVAALVARHPQGGLVRHVVAVLSACRECMWPMLPSTI